MARKVKKSKVRVTTYIDKDVMVWLRVKSMDLKVGYQTLLNKTLRLAIESQSELQKESHTKNQNIVAMLNDLNDRVKRFESLEARVLVEISELSRLKAARKRRSKLTKEASGVFSGSQASKVKPARKNRKTAVTKKKVKRKSGLRSQAVT